MLVTNVPMKNQPKIRPVLRVSIPAPFDRTVAAPNVPEATTCLGDLGHKRDGASRLSDTGRPRCMVSGDGE